MKSRKLRNFAFTLHRYIGLAVGIILIIVGLTGSLLVFENEIDPFLRSLQIERIVPQQQQVLTASLLDTVRNVYASRPELKLNSIDLPKQPDAPYTVWLKSKDDKWTEVNVNPYTGNILGTRQWENSFFNIIYRLHYELLAGKAGEIIVGIVALLLLILSITGIILWPGWRKLISGFKIKWLAHPKRVNFDIHKVSGIIAAVFLSLIAFTGFCWNFSELTDPVIYAATFTPKPIEPTSKVVAGKSPLGIAEIIQKADAALPDAATTSINLPEKADSVFQVYKKFPQQTEKHDNAVYLDQYSGEVLKVQTGSSLALGDKVLHSFTPLHYGTFGGLPTRIFYVVVGLAPLVLFITGFVMWRYRYRAKSDSQMNAREPAEQRR